MRELDPVAADGIEQQREDPALRPRNLDEYVGQQRVVENLRIYIRAAKQRGQNQDWSQG